MTRRTLLQTLLAPRVDYRDYPAILPDFLTRLAHEAYQKRRRALDSLTTPAAIAERQRWARETFWRLVASGQFEDWKRERPPVVSRVTGSFRRDGYTVENIVYETQPGLHVPANLYLPDRAESRLPAVLFQMGHSINGKAAALYQYCCQGLARLGFVVLAFDPMGQGERTYYPAANSNLTRLPSADAEHTVPGKQLLLAGLTATWLQTWDAMRSIDLLAAHPRVDARRIGVTGNSGGGTLTMFLCAADSRIACASAACPNTDPLAALQFNAPGASDDAEQNFIDGAPAGFDRWDTLYPMAPRPLQILVSAKDAFGTYSSGYIENGRRELQDLQRVYRLLGKPDHLEWIESPAPHGLAYHLRMSIYRWMRRHLQNETSPLASEPPVKAEDDPTLYASPTGNVVRDWNGLTPKRIALNRAADKRPDHTLTALLRVGKPAGTATVKGSAESRHARIDALDIASEPGVYLPAWVFHPLQPAANRITLIVLEPAGRNASWNEDSLDQALAARGITVWAPDLRGIGDLRPEFPRHNPGYARERQSDEAYAWSALMLGRPMLGQRVTDLLAVVQAARGTVRVAARGAMAIPALFAAELAPSQIENVFIYDAPKSYSELLDREDAGPTANLLFNALAHGDLPDLARGRVQYASQWTEPAITKFCGL